MKHYVSLYVKCLKMKIHVRNNYGKLFSIKKFIFFFLSLSSEVMMKQFFDFYDYYVDVCTENTNKDGQQMMVNTRMMKKVYLSHLFRIHLVIVVVYLNMELFYNV